MTHPAAAASAAVARMDSTTVMWRGVRPAATVCSLLDARTFLHAGPPLAPEEVDGPMMGGLVGALIFEGEADSPAQARAIVDSGGINLVPCHEVGAVGAATGIVSRSMPVVVVEADDGAQSFSPLNEGAGPALRFGCFNHSTIHQLHWMREVAGPVLHQGARASELELTDLLSTALRRGDECHGRTVAGRDAVLAGLASHLLDAPVAAKDVAGTLHWAASNRHFFNSLAIVTAKALAIAAEGIPLSPVVTTIASNGRRLGIRVSGMPDRWFVAEAPQGRPALFPGFSPADAAPITGDSFSTEVAGLGCAALTAAPAAGRYFGVSPVEAASITRRMRAVSAGVSSRFLVPSEGYNGTPLGINTHQIAHTLLTPMVNHAVLHRLAGEGQIGAGISELPVAPFVAAANALSSSNPAASDLEAGK